MSYLDHINCLLFFFNKNIVNNFKVFVGTLIIWQTIMLQPKDLEKVTFTYLLQTPGPKEMCWDELEKAVSE